MKARPAISDTLYRMNLSSLLSEIDKEISRLQQARDLLAGDAVKRKPGKPAGTTTKKRNLTPEGRARIAAAVKARWAKQKKINHRGQQ